MLIEKEGKFFKEVDGKEVEASAEEITAHKQAIEDEKNKGGKPNPSPADLSELAKSNPALAEILKNHEELQKKVKEDEDKRNAEAEEAAKKNGEWQNLYNKTLTEKKGLEDNLNKANTIIKDYKSLTENLLKTAVEQIPEDKRTLIPKDFSDRSKLTYILENANVLGVKSVVNVGSQVPPNDTDANKTDEQKLSGELETLLKKENKTAEDRKRMLELAQEIKKVRAETAAAKK